ncbi:hypothetical protein [Paenibacillus sp. GCM10027626]|uniref:hypothetical protein n=1 Tax=Paenibacillus sp. GCM10027626 TaxID=3273411 RepID=UPI00363C0CEE
MIDMLYIFYRMTRAEYNTAFKGVQRYFEDVDKSSKLRKDGYDKQAYITNGFAKLGFQEIRFRRNEWGYHALEIRLRPKLLLQVKAYYQLTALSEFQDVALRFDHILKDILGLTVPHFFQWQVRRVEYAADVHVQEDLIPKYLFLFKKGNLPLYFLINQETQKYWGSQTNCYFMATTVTVNWYNRYNTLLTKEKQSKKKFADFSITRGVLRFETQLRSGYGVVKDYLNCTRAENEIMKFYKLIVGKGDYYTLDGAIQLIRSKVDCFRKKLELERLITLIANSSGVWQAKELFVQGKDSSRAADKFSKRLNQLRKLGINPVVLPSEWGITKLENLFDLIKASIS